MHLDEPALRELLEEAAERGAAKALERVGLHDAAAGQDVRDLRGLLEAWRTAKTAAWKGTVSTVSKVGLTLFLGWLLLKFGMPAFLK